MTLLVVVGVAGAGVVVGLRASQAVVFSPYAVRRRQTARPPRPWGLALLALAPVLLLISYNGASQILGSPAVGLAVLGMLGLASWTAYRADRFTETHTSSAAGLIAARRLVTDPRPAGRAAAAVGGIAMVSGGAGVLTADFITNAREAFYLVSVGLVGVALMLALVVVTGTLAVHSAETILDRKRSIASLAAVGTSPRTLEESQRWEAALTALPVAVIGVLLGAAPLIVLADIGPLGAALIAANLVLTALLVWLAILAATAITRPWVARAVSPANLRTE